MIIENSDLQIRLKMGSFHISRNCQNVVDITWKSKKLCIQTMEVPNVFKKKVKSSFPPFFFANFYIRVPRGIRLLLEDIRKVGGV